LVNRASRRSSEMDHGPLKLRTVHLSDNTIIYESKVSVQNVFPDLKALICQDHTQNFRSIAHSSKKIETPKVDFID
jgi:peroxiredoxin